MTIIPYLTKAGGAVGGEYYGKHIRGYSCRESIPSYQEWIKEQGGRFVSGYNKETRIGHEAWSAYIEFEDEQDAVVFKLKYV
jgi:hypothetical protein